MLKWLRNKIELFKLDREERALYREGKRKQAEAKEKEEPGIFEEWENNYADHIYGDIRWARKKLTSDALMREADELHLPRPQYDDKSKWDEETDSYGMTRGLVMTPEAMTELRSTIRKERKERREVYEWWVKLIGSILTILTGLVGALIGLTSVWKHK